MLEVYAVPHLEELQPFISVHDGAPHTEITVCKHFLVRRFMEEGLGHGGFHGPLTKHHCFPSCVGYIKGLCIQNFYG
jgi:hypothetical protein